MNAISPITDSWRQARTPLLGAEGRRDLPTGELVKYRTAGGAEIGYVDEAAHWRRLGGEDETETVISWTALA